jgi:disulfide bond formation protein DsbB
MYKAPMWRFNCLLVEGIGMSFLSGLVDNKKAWLLLAFSALALEFTALFFQLALDLKPCIMCIYQRVALWAVFLAGIVGSICAKYLIGRIVAFGLWGTGAIWGLLIAIEHVEMQTATFSFLYSCEFVPNFPSWAPLHEWLPLLFAATGDCGDIDWQWFGYSMPQMMIIVYSCYTALLFAVIATQLFKKKMI